MQGHRKIGYDFEFQKRTFQIREIISAFLISQAWSMLELIKRSCMYDIHNQRYNRSYKNVLVIYFQSQSLTRRCLRYFANA